MTECKKCKSKMGKLKPGANPTTFEFTATTPTM
jgi:hypothetical protein